jgi:acetyl esterase
MTAIEEDRTRPPESYLDPQMKEFLRLSAAAAASYPNTFEVPINEARAAIEAAQRPFAADGPRMHLTEDRWIDIGGRRILVRYHQPTPRTGTPVIVFLHGGGWTWNSIDTHDRVAREYAERTGFVVLSPDYAMAPEYPFPIPVQECVRVVEWLSRHGGDWGIDPTRIAIGGDSAGANLSLAACMMLRGTPAMPRAALLNYGAFEPRYDRDAHRWLGESTLSPQTWKMKWFWRSYLQADDTTDWRAAPLLGSLADLPPLRIQVGQLDILCDENRALAEAAQKAGTEAECIVYPGVTHGFLRAVGHVDVAAKAIQDGSDWLRDKLAG